MNIRNTFLSILAGIGFVGYVACGQPNETITHQPYEIKIGTCRAVRTRVDFTDQSFIWDVVYSDQNTRLGTRYDANADGYAEKTDPSNLDRICDITK